MMVEEPVLVHIGYPKTATTWFQEEFFPKIKNGYLMPRDIIRKPLLEPSPFEFNANKTVEVIRNILKKEKVPIFSDEVLMSGNNYLVKERALRLKQVFKNPEIIVFIRNQTAMFPSLYSYYLKRGGGTFSFKNYVNINSRFALNNLVLYDKVSMMYYDQIISFYKSLFGCNHVHIFLFEDFVENPHLFLDTFAKKFGLDFDPSNISLKKQNEGLRAGVVPVARFLNSFTAKNRFDKHYYLNMPRLFPIAMKIINRLNKLPIFGNTITIQSLLSESDLIKFQSQFHESNKKLITEHKLSDIQKYNYPL